ncbi:YagK/YfjJ domain-containing protein [Stutzerimonas nitrititolerans]|uniref:YagK/YfjJ domain-containing protein n=1 Tax=Stutzerimonas nitrititolerans TaxID=2482751 RepID=UPI0028AD236C|nr:inovirus-type Gp2 protein [Stutzerimonas nitrititolerans]
MKKTVASSFRGLPINASAARGEECYVQILTRIHHQLFSLMTHHSRITVIRVDLRFSDEMRLDHKKEGALVSAYIERIKKELGSLGNYGKSKVIHLAVKEIGEKNGKSHFHLFFGFQCKYRSLGEINGSGHTKVWRTIDQTWTDLSGGTTHIVPKVHMFDRGHSKELEDCFRHLSYLAKASTKHFNTGDTYKRYRSSRLQPKFWPVPHDSGVETFENENVCERCANNQQLTDLDDFESWKTFKGSISTNNRSSMLS